MAGNGKVEIGDVVDGFTVTEVRGEAIYGVAGRLPKEIVDSLRAHFAKPEKERGFMFRPGRRIDGAANGEP